MYDYIGTHTDDLLVISKDVKSLFDELEASFEFKTTSEPEYHLGIYYIKKGGKWQLGSFTYVRECLKNTASILGKPALGKSNVPMKSGSHPECDTSTQLDSGGHNKYQQLVGIGVWLVLIGRFDIGYAVTSLSRFSACPRVNHLLAIAKVFDYLNKHPDRRILVDGSDDILHGKDMRPD